MKILFCSIAAIEFNELIDDDLSHFCDFSMLYMKHDNNSAQRGSFRMIYHKLHSLREGDHLKLVALPLLTQFNVNLLCVLRQIFKEVNIIIFVYREFIKWNT